MTSYLYIKCLQLKLKLSPLKENRIKLNKETKLLITFLELIIGAKII